jgi:hypothetical protein
LELIHALVCGAPAAGPHALTISQAGAINVPHVRSGTPAEQDDEVYRAEVGE